MAKVSKLIFFAKIDSLPVLPNGQIPPESKNGKLWIKFPKKQEGYIYQSHGFLEKSGMRMPHNAPIRRYAPNLEREEKAYHDKNMKSNTGIFLRVSVKQDAEGKVKTAHYVKIASDISFDPRETGWHFTHKNKPTQYGRIRFTYYFNPIPNDRNLEFDPEKNLFKKLKHEEQVRQP